LPVAEAAARVYRDDLQRLRAHYAQRPKLSVFYQVWDRPLYTLSGKQVLNEMLNVCGGENVFADLSALAPAVDREAVLARKPRMPSDLEARLLQDSSLPIDSLLHDEVRHALRRGFWDALERVRH